MILTSIDAVSHQQISMGAQPRGWMAPYGWVSVQFSDWTQTASR